MHSFKRLTARLLAVGLSACTGTVGDPSSPAASEVMDTSPDDAPTEVVTVEMCEGRPPAVGAAPLLRLTRRQYAFTIEDLFGVEARVGNLPVDARAGGFSGNVGAPNEAQSVTQYSETAADVAPSVDLAGLFACLDDGCAPSLVADVGRRMFRRPLFDMEKARYEGLFFTGRDALGLDPADSATLVLEAMLQSPSFLVRGEEAVSASESEGPVLLDGYEIASRLSHFIYQSTPDAALLAAAEEGLLDSAAGIEEAAREMLADPRAERAIVDFHLQWLWLRSGDGHHWPTAPGVSPELYAAMMAETGAFVAEVVREGTLADLFTSSWSYVNEPLAELYGLDTITGEELRRTELDSAERAGILTQPLFIATHHRTDRLRPVPLGHMIRERVLCEGLPPPPPNIPELRSDPDLTAREIAALHAEDPACGGCHRLMDPIGFTWSNFDRLGRFRANDEDGAPIDASGELVDAGDASGTVEGVVELGHMLAGSQKVRGCYAESWFAFALGRALEDADACSRAAALDRFQASGYRVEELILGIVTSNAFRYRAVAGPTTEVCQ